MENNYTKMLETPVSRLIIKLSIPTTVSMLITAVYSMVDTYFVTKLGVSASGAVGIVFSLMTLIQAIGYTIGMGAGTQISRMLGEKEEGKADIVSSTAFYSALVLGGLVTVVGTLWLKPLMQLLGATETMLPYAIEYARYILYSAPVMCGSYVLSTLLRAEGKAKASMVGIAVGGLLNLGLDPLLIFVMDMGIRGASIATAISQTAGFFVLLFLYTRKKVPLHIKIRDIGRKWDAYGAILKNGMPSFFRQGMAAAAGIFLNTAAGNYGDTAVAAMAIVGKIFMIVFSIIIGFAQGYQPVVGYSYGAEQYKRVKQAFWFTGVLSTGLMIGIALLGILFSEQILGWFISGDAEVIKIGSRALKLQCYALPFIPVGVVANITFQSVEKTCWANITSCARQGIFFLPLIWTLPRFWGLAGIQMVQPLSDILTFFGTVPFIILFLKNLKRASE